MIGLRLLYHCIRDQLGYDLDMGHSLAKLQAWQTGLPYPHLVLVHVPLLILTMGVDKRGRLIIKKKTSQRGRMLIESGSLIVHPWHLMRRTNRTLRLLLRQCVNRDDLLY